MPKESINADTLDGHHANDFLTANTPLSKNNLNVWITSLNTYTFSAVTTRINSSNISFFYVNPSNYVGIGTYKPRGKIGTNVTDCLITITQLIKNPT